jgi:hypothetical protein
MEFFSVQINSNVLKSFITYELALAFVKNKYTTDSKDQIEIYHEEYPDHGHAHSEAHGYKTLVYLRN